MTNKTYDAMIKRNGKKKEKKKETKKSNKFSTVPNTGDFGALAAKTKPVPPISKEARVKRADPNKPRPKYFDIRETGDSPIGAAVFTAAANLGAFDKEDKVTQPMEAKVKKKAGGKVMFSRGGGVATQGTKFSRNG
jgi:hypothetical protein|tara:strand:+ start:3519 stop:3926 length:408 start_codon:yes stop_codon:yes gene_type:complete